MKGEAKAHARLNRQARNRLSKVASAKDTIAGFGHGMDVAGLTYGQFSLIDLIQATLEIIGPADVTVSTWSAGFYDIEAAENFRADGRLRSIRFIMDSAAQRRGQATNDNIAGLFGEAAIRTTRSHAKFAILINESWQVVITSSMNLNLNPRLEQFEMTDDADRAALFLEFADGLFAELPEGVTTDRTMPALEGMESVQPDLGLKVDRNIQAGRTIRVGRRD